MHLWRRATGATKTDAEIGIRWDVTTTIGSADTDIEVVPISAAQYSVFLPEVTGCA